MPTRFWLTLGIAFLTVACGTETTHPDGTSPDESTGNKDTQKKRVKKPKNSNKKSSNSSRKSTKKSPPPNSKPSSTPNTSDTPPGDAPQDDTAERESTKRAESAKGKIELDTTATPPDTYQKPDEERLKRDAKADLRDNPDATHQHAKPNTSPINTLSDAFKDVTTLVVTERDIPFKVLSFANRTFTISDSARITQFLDAAGATAQPMNSCPRCMTTFTITAKDAQGQDRAHLEMYCGGAVSTPIIHNTFTSQCWTVQHQGQMKSLLETASR